MSDVDHVARLLDAGGLAVLPTDTVYGLVCTASREQPAVDLYALKGRRAVQPTAVLFASVDALLASLPGLPDPAEAAVRELLPGPYTLVLPNPARRFGWLNAARPDAVGARVPVLPVPTAAIVERAVAVVATSANLPGGPDTRRIADVPARILAGAGAVVDGGTLPGSPSTVLDLTGPEPVLLRAGAGDPAAALARLAVVQG